MKMGKIGIFLEMQRLNGMNFTKTVTANEARIITGTET